MPGPKRNNILRNLKLLTAVLLAGSMTIGGMTAYSAIISDVPSAVSTSENADSSKSAGSSSGTQNAAGTSVSTAVPGTTGSSTASGNSSASGSSTAGGSSSASNGSTGSSAGPTASSAAVITPETAAITASSSAGGAVIVDVPGSISASSSSTSVSIDMSTVQSGSAPGSSYADAASTSVDLGFTVVSPNYSYNGFNVAEGKVQLGNGTWVSIGHDKYIRQPYYRLLREDGDWYVVSVHASRIGNYSTADGSTVTELWLKKSECTASSSIELNTTNATRQKIVKEALSLLGRGYKYAGNGPDAYDCSGLVHAVMNDFGISVARNSYGICNAGTEVGINGLRPGDIVGRPGHVGIYIGNGYFVHAAETTVGVIADSIAVYNSSSASFTAYRNVVGD